MAVGLSIPNVFLRYMDCVPIGISVASSPSAYPNPEIPEAQIESSKFKPFQFSSGSEVGIKYLNSSPWFMSVLG